MHKTISAALAVAMSFGGAACVPSDERLRDYYVVGGVEAGDMLKLRAGPGTGYRVILGIPNGAILRVYRCEQTGGTRWCKVSLKSSRMTEGYVSWAYLREI